MSIEKRRNMNGEGILGSGVPAKVGTSDYREFWPDVGSIDGQNLRRPPGPPTPKLTTSFMGLQITTHTQTREIEEERKRKNGVKTQGTLKLGLGHHGSTLNQGKRWRKTKHSRRRTNPRAQSPPPMDSPPHQSQVHHDPKKTEGLGG